jgi:hypothetical protein
MKIAVTLMDIGKAEEARNNLQETQACPIYQACKRILGDKLLGVSRRYIWTKDEKDYLLPKEAIDFTLAFDAKKEVKPFKFEVK